MAKKATGPVIAVVHAERLYELMGTCMARADAAAHVKHEFGMEQTVPTIIKAALVALLQSAKDNGPATLVRNGMLKMPEVAK